MVVRGRPPALASKLASDASTNTGVGGFLALVQDTRLSDAWLVTHLRYLYAAHGQGLGEDAKRRLYSEGDPTTGDPTTAM
jgi:hypothetical protein